MTDPIREHVRRLLTAPLRAEQARRRRARAIVLAGRRVVQDRRTSATGWELRDWLTGAVLAAGEDGPAGLAAALAGTYHADGLYAEIPGPGPQATGLPSTLAATIEEWVAAVSTPDEEIAEFIGWPVAKVRECR